MITFDGLDDAIINAIPKGESYKVVYDRGAIVDILVERDEMTYEEADEFASFNIDCLYAGEFTPIIHSEYEGEEYE